MSTELRLLRPSGYRFLTVENLVSSDPIPVGGHLLPFPGGSVDLRALDAVMKRGVEEHASSKGDAWLAPRVYAALRLTRSEAADPRLWAYLATRYPDYVVQRWMSNGKIGSERIHGRVTRQAIARLWWTAELGRNGKDLAPVVSVFASQRAALYLIDVDAFHNRIAAQAYIAKIAANDEAKIEKIADRLGTGLNFELATIALDAIAPDSSFDSDALDQWLAPRIEGDIDETLLLESKVPLGPLDREVPKKLVERVTSLLDEILSEGDMQAAS